MDRARKNLAIIAVAAFLLSSIPPVTEAQLFKPEVAPGFVMEIDTWFADQTNVEEFAASAYSGPTAITFDSRGRLFVATYSGKILILLDNDENGRADEVRTFASGLPILLGIEFGPDGSLYASQSILISVPGAAGRILRLRDTDGDDSADEITVMVDGLPSDGNHQTNRLKFGPDGLLYFGQGSSTAAGEPNPGRPPERPLNATMLRIDVDDPVVEVFATGLRNPFGMAFDPVTGALFATDPASGELGEGGFPANDEVNLIVEGADYGFPGCEGIPDPEKPRCEGVTAPALIYQPHVTPTSLAFYTGPQAGEFENQLLVTLYKKLPGAGGDLRRVAVNRDEDGGITLTDIGFIAKFNPIDPFDGPLDTAIDPITGDIYVARFDPVTHRDLNEHHHFIYRIRRVGTDGMPFIGPVKPGAIKAGSGQVTVKLVGKRVKPGALVYANDQPLFTRFGQSLSDIYADVPASMTQSPGTVALELRNLDGSTSNPQPFEVTVDDPPEPGAGPGPEITSVFVYKLTRDRVVNRIVVKKKAKKFRLVVAGERFDEGSQLLVNDIALGLDSASSTELVGRFANNMFRTAGDLVIRVRDSKGALSNSVTIAVLP